MKLLLAEDEKELSNALAAILKHNRYTVDAVYDGQDALDYARMGDYDGIILDIMMPKMDGITVLTKLRSSQIMTPVLLLTAKAEIDDRINGLDSGADDYLTKPFDMRELLARVRAMLRRRTELSMNELVCGNITLNQKTFELSCKEKSIRLSNKEFQMLHMMMNPPGILISAEQFIERIWGYDTESEINVVWVYISYLRKKLTSIDANVKIRAARGIGYVLEETV